MKSASDYPHKLEFVCSQCLASVYSNDDDPVPHCARCLIRMLPDKRRTRDLPLGAATTDEPAEG